GGGITIGGIQTFVIVGQAVGAIIFAQTDISLRHHLFGRTGTELGARAAVHLGPVLVRDDAVCVRQAGQQVEVLAAREITRSARPAFVVGLTGGGDLGVLMRKEL